MLLLISSILIRLKRSEKKEGKLVLFPSRPSTPLASSPLQKLIKISFDRENIAMAPHPDV